MTHILIMIPTYNEAENIPALVDRISALKTGADILFIDDNSPDGTGDILDKYASIHNNITVIHRRAKNGIGTAHKHGIEWAYRLQKYTHLITMDGDFTHSPEDIPRLLTYSGDYDIVIGGRHERKDSIEGWTPWRKFLTTMGHQFTKNLLHLKYDATTAFRIYRIDIIPLTTFNLVKSKRYSFFIESLCILNENKFTMYDVPVILPPRKAGASKLRFADMVDWLITAISLGIRIRIHDETLYDKTITEKPHS